MKLGYLYILASRPGGAIYVGITGNLVKRMAEYKNKLVPGHTKRYGIDKRIGHLSYEFGVVVGVAPVPGSKFFFGQ